MLSRSLATAIEQLVRNPALGIAVRREPVGVPVADVPVGDLPAADLPAVHLHAADLPAADGRTRDVHADTIAHERPGVLDRPERHEATRHRALPTGSEVETPLGRHFLIRRPLSALARSAADGWRVASAREAAREEGLHPEAAAFARHFPRRVLLLDLETCGLAGAPIFLAGVVWESEAGPVVEQLLARNYAEEAAILSTLWDRAARADVLVTFNGKSFDWPLVRDRTTVHRLRPRRAGEPAVHFDLLHHARRRWKSRLPNCRLQTLEWHVCGRLRRGDIPGAEIPAAYDRYVRGGDARAMRSILHHNALDLVTLAELALRLSG